MNDSISSTWSASSCDSAITACATSSDAAGSMWARISSSGTNASKLALSSRRYASSPATNASGDLAQHGGRQREAQRGVRHR